MEYRHGAFAEINATGNSEANTNAKAIVYIGTAPVHNVVDGAKNVNVPIVIHDMSEAYKYIGYSDDWAAYTLCEAVYVHLMQKKVGPIIVINVLDPATHKQSTGGTASLTPANGKIIIPAAESIVLDSVAISTKTKGTDYTVSYNQSNKTITIAETSAGSLGTSALSVSYDIIDPSAVDADDVIGTTDDMGSNTGLYVLRAVNQKTGFIPSYIAAPGFSSIKAVHDKMIELSHNINGHWNDIVYADLPLMNDETPLTLATANTYKEANGYNKPNEKVFYPMIEKVDGRKYHLSVLAFANFQELISDPDVDGIPFRSVSNTEIEGVANLYFGEDSADKTFDDVMISNYLNKNGITSAAWVSNRWVIWGSSAADYVHDGTDGRVIVADTNVMMLYHIANDFQARRGVDADRSMTPNDIKNVASQEQSRLDGLVTSGALTYGKVVFDDSREARSDLLKGDIFFNFQITTTPLVKSLTARVNHTDKGFEIFFEDLTSYEQE